MQHRAHPSLDFTHPLPYGALVWEGGVQFVVFSRSATGMRVLLYNRVRDRDPAEVIELDPDTDRWGDMWSVFVPGIGPGQLYHFQADGPGWQERINMALRQAAGLVPSGQEGRRPEDLNATNDD